MPDVLARQSPRLLFSMLDNIRDEQETPDVSTMTEYEKMFYGF